MANPMPELRALVERVANLTKDMGLVVHRAQVTPGNPDILEVTYIVDESAFRSDEQKQMDAQFAELEAQLKREARNEKLDASRGRAQTDLESWLTEGE